MKREAVPSQTPTRLWLPLCSLSCKPCRVSPPQPGPAPCTTQSAAGKNSGTGRPWLPGQACAEGGGTGAAGPSLPFPCTTLSHDLACLDSSLIPRKAPPWRPQACVWIARVAHLHVTTVTTHPSPTASQHPACFLQLVHRPCDPLGLAGEPSTRAVYSSAGQVI